MLLSIKKRRQETLTCPGLLTFTRVEYSKLKVNLNSGLQMMKITFLSSSTTQRRDSWHFTSAKSGRGRKGTTWRLWELKSRTTIRVTPVIMAVSSSVGTLVIQTKPNGLMIQQFHLIVSKSSRKVKVMRLKLFLSSHSARSGASGTPTKTGTFTPLSLMLTRRPRPRFSQW